MDKYNRITKIICILALSFFVLGVFGAFGFIGEKYEMLSSMFLSIGSVLGFFIPILQSYFAYKRDQELKNKTIDIIEKHLDML